MPDNASFLGSLTQYLPSLDSAFLLDKVLPQLTEGLFFSLGLILPSLILGFACGVVLGTVRAFGSKPLRWVGDAYTSLIRGVPLVIQLFLLYYGLPKIGIKLDGYWAAVLGFTLCSAAYHSEYVRGALLSIRQGQIKGAQALGFSGFSMLTSIIVPQALRRALPGCGNEFVYLVKYSSLAYVCACPDLSNAAMSLSSEYFKYTEVFIVAGLYYLTMTTAASFFLQWVERRLHIPGFGR